jgi:YidC/Oxa1 family membrane protein insertase
VISKIDGTTGLLPPDQLQHLYGYLQAKYATTSISTDFLGFVDLAATKNYILAVLAGAFSFYQVRMMQSRKPAIKTPGSRDESIAALMSKQTTFVLPILTVFLGVSFPAGITLYWLFSTLFTIGQQWYFIKRHKHPKPEDTVTVNQPL